MIATDTSNTLRRVALTGLASVIAFAGAGSAAAAGPAPAACSSAEHHQFDFWVGRWAVYANGKPDRKVADSLIEAVYGGCGVRENWMPLGGAGAGGSLSTYVPDRKAWRQFWIDAGGSAVDFTGGWTGGAMVLTGTWPQPGHDAQITRMTYTPLAGGSVEQKLETSDDAGRTWAPSDDLIYRPAPAG